MTNCFIFTNDFSDDQCLCVRFSANGECDAPLALRPIAEVRLLQEDARTTLVLPATCAGLHDVELPWLSERKARLAMPYALEEQLAQSVTSMHFAFDKAHYRNNRYLVVVMDQLLLQGWMAKLDELYLSFDAITLDWFSLQDNEIAVLSDSILINEANFKGALTADLAELYWQRSEKEAPVWVFSDSLSVLKQAKTIRKDSPSLAFVAERLLQKPGINVCQGTLQRDTRWQAGVYWYRVSLILLGVFFLSTLCFKLLYLYFLNSDLKELDQKTAVIYREFFPEATQVISPRFRVAELLKTGFSNPDTSAFWSLLDKFSDAIQGTSLTVEQFRFQNRVLSVMLTSQDFAALEQAQQRLERAGVKVTQSQASTHETHAIATWELSL